jgi:hypothetical protein
MRGRHAAIAFAAVIATGALASPAAAAPDCANSPSPRVLYSGQGLLESVIVGRAGRLYFSSRPSVGTPRLLKVDHPGAPPRVLAADLDSPGGMVWHQRHLLVGFGDSVANGSQGDDDPASGLLRMNAKTGAHSTYVKGLGMANGVARAPDGTIFASNDFGRRLDRIADRKVTHGWAEVESGNGLAVDPSGRFLYVAQTFGATAIQRVEIAHPGNVETFASAPEEQNAFLDGMTRDRPGNLYVAANGAGEIWRIDTKGRICVLAHGLQNPSAVAFGRGMRRFQGGNLYAVTFSGDVVELPGANRARFAG